MTLTIIAAAEPPVDPARLVREVIERNNAEVYEAGGPGVWGDPDGGMLRYSAGLLAVLNRHTLSVECSYWTCSACGPLGYTEGRPCPEVAGIVDALEVAW